MIVRRLFAIGLVSVGLCFPIVRQVVAIAAPSQILAAYSSLTMFTAENAAQAHCPGDVVVWLNTKTGIWHEKGMRWYGRTRSGAYVCRKEGAAAGYRDTKNGQ